MTGSTAFAPVVETLAKEYEKDCEGADITVEARGSEAGVSALAATGARSAKDARSVIAFSDGAMGDRLGLHGEKIALSVFTLVVNDGIDLGSRGLTRAEVERLYRGEVRRWSDLNAARPAGLPRLPGLPVVLVSRDAYSGTRQIFQDRVLAGAWEMTPTTSLDCDPLTDKAVAAARAPVTRCELASTEDVLDKVADQPGALGYSELTLATGHKGVRRVPLDGESASADHLDRYPYRGVEYAYTYRSPAPGSLAAGFLAYLDEGTSQDVIREQGHLPCGRAAGLCD
ncbi:substrate-binding domain-containing protein [Streptomyces canus]|uniref:substrate-binding domain-containing protein n=1 Tax=Streptomyces canus TaxID=58343 RepID=UPI00371E8D4C